MITLRQDTPISQNVIPQVSVVIPVYNVAPYITQCSEALFSQTLDDIEYIFVDDASQDDSMGILSSILEKYPHRKPFVKTITHRSNLGISASRRDGVRAARAKFIIHCDPDDIPHHNLYETLLKTALQTRAGITSCDVTLHTPDGTVIVSQDPATSDSGEYLKSLVQARMPLLNCWLWNKLIARELYEGIIWPENLSFSEDKIILLQLVAKTRKIQHVGRPLYDYFQRNGSLSQRVPSKETFEENRRIIHQLKVISDTYSVTSTGSLYPTAAAFYLVDAFIADQPVFDNIEARKLLRSVQSGIRHNKSLSWKFKYLLLASICNYSLTFHFYQRLRRLKKIFSGNKKVTE